MTPPADPERYKNHRFPGEIISHGVWLYYRFPLSYRDVQELLFERGIDVTHEAIRQWCLKFGQDYANRLKRRRAQPGDKWHLDEVFLTINGKRHYLWRAVDQDDNGLCRKFSFATICGMIFLHDQGCIMRESNDGGEFQRCPFPPRGYSHGSPLVCGVRAP
jgi:hypothetical protein